MDRIELKAQISVTEEGAIEGTAWPFTGPDRVGDVIEKGAFATATAPLPMLAHHDQKEVIGVWDEISETDQGLTVKGRLLIDDVARAREVRALVREGAMSGLSIGFKSRKALPRKGGGRVIGDLELFEISVVAVPAHPGARITSAKEMTMTEETEAKGIEALEAKMADIEKKADQAPLIARLDKLEAKLNRPSGGEDQPADDEVRKAFTHYLSTGQMEAKALTFASDTTSHVLAPEQIEAEFIRNLVEFSPIRQIADVRSTVANNVILPKRTGITNAVWVSETDTRTGSQPSFGQMNVPVYEIATFVDMSLQLAEDSANVLSEVNLALAEDFGQKEALAFVNGGTFTAPATGPSDPQGFMTATGIDSHENGSSDIFSDSLIAMMYALPATYRQAGTWVMNGTTLAHIRTLKDGHGNYLWQPSYQAGQPETILGRPVVEAVDMDDIAEDAFPIIFGDFKRGYRIYDRLSLSILADPYTMRVNGQMRYHARRRVGAGVVRPEAFIKLEMVA